MPLVQPTIYRAVLEALESRRPAALCTVVATKGSVPGKLGAKMLIYADGSQLGTIGGAGIEERVRELAVEAIRSGRGGTHSFDLNKWVAGGLNSICGGSAEVYVEVLTPPPHLLLVGGGHVAQAIAKICADCEYTYSVIDDRAEFVAKDLFPSAANRIHQSSDEGQLELSPYSDIYLLGYSWEIDTAWLAQILPATDTWVGLIGSRTKDKTTREELAKTGVAQDHIDRLVCPIGLNIGAESPAEIAVAVMADLIQRHKGRKNGPGESG